MRVCFGWRAIRTLDSSRQPYPRYTRWRQGGCSRTERAKVFVERTDPPQRGGPISSGSESIKPIRVTPRSDDANVEPPCIRAIAETIVRPRPW